MSHFPRERERERTAQALSLSSLAAWESSNGPNPRRTVQQFVQNQSTQIYSPPPKHSHRLGFNPDSSPPARNGLLDRRTEENDVNGGREGEMAMVLGGKDTRALQVVGVESGRKRESGGVSRVAKMKPRTSSNAIKSTPPLAEVERTTTKQQNSYSSPLVVPRVRSGEDSVEKENLGISNRADGRSKDGMQHESPVKKVKRTREVIVVPVRSLLKPSASKLPKADESEEDEEHVERLAARKSRRRAKALIVKDRTTTPAETGAAAASKVKKARRVSKNQTDEESEVEETRGRKRGKKGMEAVKESLKARDRAANVAEKRLTLPPPLKLGLFSKGVASARTKVTKKQSLPELGFSELAFLNAPRRSPSPESVHTSSASSSALSPPPAKSKEKLAPIFGKVIPKKSKAKVTYKSQAKRKSSSNYFDVEENEDESDAAPLPKKSRKEFDIPAKSKAKSRKDVLRESESAQHRGVVGGRGGDAASPSVVSRASDHSAFSNLAADRRETSEVVEEVIGNVGDYGEGEEMVIDTPSTWKEMGNVEESKRTTQQHNDAYSPPPASALHSIPPLISPILPLSDHSLSVRSFPPDSLSPPTAIIPDEVVERDDTPDTLDRLLRACETGELVESPVENQTPFAKDEERHLVSEQLSDPVSFDGQFSHTDSADLRNPERAMENFERIESDVEGYEVDQACGQDDAGVGPYTRSSAYEGAEEMDEEPQLFGDYDSQEEEDEGYVIEEGVAGSSFQSALHQPWSEFRQIGEAEEERRNYSEAMKSHWRKAKP